MKKALTMTAVLLMAWNGAEAQRAVPMTLKAMVRQAGTIVHAIVAETRTGSDPVTGLPATWVTLKVTENFHGAPGSSFTFKQIGGEANGMAYRPADVPRYTKGEELVLLLYPPHRTTGFSSPVGLGQGKFIVKSSPAPRKKVVEQITPSNVLRKESLGVSSDRTMTFDELAGEIRSFVKAGNGGVR